MNDPLFNKIKTNFKLLWRNFQKKKFNINNLSLKKTTCCSWNSLTVKNNSKSFLIVFFIALQYFQFSPQWRNFVIISKYYQWTVTRNSSTHSDTSKYSKTFKADMKFDWKFINKLRKFHKNSKLLIFWCDNSSRGSSEVM